MWQIKGLSYLEEFTGLYDQAEAFAVLVQALERSESIVDFDSFIEARDDGGRLLSGSQVLEHLSQG